MRRSTGFTLIELIVVLGIIAVVLSLMITAFAGANDAARRINCVNNLRQLHLGMQSYHACHGVYPPGVVGHERPVAESPLGHRLGWTSMILPYAEQQAIYSTLNFDVGAEDPSNATARSCQMNTYACPSSSPGPGFSPGLWSMMGGPARPRDAGLVNYVGCHDPREKAIDLDARGVFFLNSRIRAAEVFDGLSQTIFLGEVARASSAGWLAGGRSTLRNTGSPINRVDSTALGEAARSESWRTSPMTPEALESLIGSGDVVPPPGYVGGFGSRHRGDGSVFAFGDGSVRFLRSSIEPAVFHSLGDRDDGEDDDDDSH